MTRRAAGVAVVAVVALGAPALAQPSAPEDFGVPTMGMLAASVHVWDPSGYVEAIETEQTDGAETVVNLDSDILFTFGSAELPTTAAQRIGELVGQVPRAASVRVTGHTDDVGTGAANQVLSEQRAQAVAAAVAVARPDLVLDVQGRGESDPAGPNTTPEGREDNRRVEIRYGG